RQAQADCLTAGVLPQPELDLPFARVSGATLAEEHRCPSNVATSPLNRRSPRSLASYRAVVFFGLVRRVGHDDAVFDETCDEVWHDFALWKHLRVCIVTDRLTPVIAAAYMASSNRCPSHPFHVCMVNRKESRRHASCSYIICLP